MVMGSEGGEGGENDSGEVGMLRKAYRAALKAYKLDKGDQAMKEAKIAAKSAWMAAKEAAEGGGDGTLKECAVGIGGSTGMRGIGIGVPGATKRREKKKKRPNNKSVPTVKRSPLVERAKLSGDFVLSVSGCRGSRPEHVQLRGVSCDGSLSSLALTPRPTFPLVAQQYPGLHFTLPPTTMPIKEREKKSTCQCCSEPCDFKVRGAHYLKDRKKVLSAPPILHLLGVDLMLIEDARRRRHLLAQPSYHVSAFRSKAGAAQAPWLFIVNFIVKTGSIAAVWTSGSRGAPTCNKLLADFVSGDDEFRKKRLKLIPRIPKGNLLIRSTVGSKPAILGTKGLNIEYKREPGSLEVTIDLTASRIAKGIWGVVQRFAAKSVIDLAFVIEGQSPEELPEQLLATVRFHRGKFVRRRDGV